MNPYENPLHPHELLAEADRLGVRDEIEKMINPTIAFAEPDKPKHMRAPPAVRRNRKSARKARRRNR